MGTKLLNRLDELDKKRDRYEDDVDIMLKQEREILMEIGRCPTTAKRVALWGRLRNLSEAVCSLEPLTPDEIAERDALMGIRMYVMQWED